MDFDPSCLLRMSKDGCRKIAAMHVALNAVIIFLIVRGTVCSYSKEKSCLFEKATVSFRTSHEECFLEDECNLQSHNTGQSELTRWKRAITRDF